MSKKKLAATLFAAMALNMFNFSQLPMVHAETQPDLIILAEADTHVQAWRDEKQRNYGAKTTMRVRTDNTAFYNNGFVFSENNGINSYYRNANGTNRDTGGTGDNADGKYDIKMVYVRFDISKIPQDKIVEKAMLKFTAASDLKSGAGNYHVFPVNNITWIEGTTTTDNVAVHNDDSKGMNWYSRPELGTTDLGKCAVPAKNITGEINVTEYIEAEDKRQRGKTSMSIMIGSGIEHEIYSREAGDGNAPKLEITYLSQTGIDALSATAKAQYDIDKIPLLPSVIDPEDLTGVPIDDYLITKGTVCGSDITWTSDHPSIIDPSTGKVTFPAPGEASVTVTLTATINVNDEETVTKTREFVLTVKPKPAYLHTLTYTPTYKEDGETGQAVPIALQEKKTNYTVHVPNLYSAVEKLKLDGGFEDEGTYDGSLSIVPSEITIGTRDNSKTGKIGETATLMLQKADGDAVVQTYTVLFVETIPSNQIIRIDDVVNRSGGKGDITTTQTFNNLKIENGSPMLYFPSVVGTTDGASVTLRRMNALDNPSTYSQDWTGFFVAKTYAAVAGKYDVYIMCYTGGDTRSYQISDVTDIEDINSISVSSGTPLVTTGASADATSYSDPTSSGNNGSSLKILTSQISLRVGNNNLRIQAPPGGNAPNFIAMTFRQVMTDAPAFADDVTSSAIDSGAVTANFTLAASSLDTEYIVYDSQNSDAPATGVTASVSDTTLTLTFEQALTTGKTYYIAAKQTDKAETPKGQRVQITVTITNLSTNATASALTYSTGDDGHDTGVPDFVSGTFAYEVILDSLADGTAITLNATPTDSNATVTTPPPTATLQDGECIVPITIQAEDGLTTQTYTVTFKSRKAQYTMYFDKDGQPVGSGGSNVVGTAEITQVGKTVGIKPVAKAGYEFAIINLISKEVNGGICTPASINGGLNDGGVYEFKLSSDAAETSNYLSGNHTIVTGKEYKQMPDINIYFDETGDLLNEFLKDNILDKDSGGGDVVASWVDPAAPIYCASLPGTDTSVNSWKKVDYTAPLGKMLVIEKIVVYDRYGYSNIRTNSNAGNAGLEYSNFVDTLSQQQIDRVTGNATSRFVAQRTVYDIDSKPDRLPLKAKYFRVFAGQDATRLSKIKVYGKVVDVPVAQTGLTKADSVLEVTAAKGDTLVVVNYDADNSIKEMKIKTFDSTSAYTYNYEELKNKGATKTMAYLWESLISIQPKGAITLE